MTSAFSTRAGAYFSADQPLGRTILGPKQNILSIKRDDLASYIKTNYTADRMVLVGTGVVRRRFGKEVRELGQLTLELVNFLTVAVANILVRLGTHINRLARDVPSIPRLALSSDSSHLVF